MDEVDIAILSYLSGNSRMHSTEIASNMGVATSTVHKRIERMRDAGVIREFTIKIDPSVVGLNITTFIGVNMDSSKRINIINKLKKIDDVLEIHELLEPYDILIKVQTFDIHSLKENVLQVLGEMDGVKESTSILTTKCHKDVGCAILYR
ncbi:Lrp/AsnC family transcriptional regulator [Methanolobus sp. ZRKC3]|uniref:Lrp/AsnC family transcriptional regulator n=1 Tax=Methanolobus sp. ZRKC3 TaxID=3125786 RepID=UPI00324589CD